MKKAFTAALCLFICTVMLAACATDGGTAPDDTVPSPAETTPVETTPTPVETTPAVTTRDPMAPIIARGTVKTAELGIRPHTVTISDPAIIECEKGASITRFYGYGEGTVNVSFTDCFGHTASAVITVAGDSMDIAVTPTTDKFIEASMHFGATPNDQSDDTKAIQQAIDSAKPGETVYLYPGLYVTTLLVMREGVTLEMYTTMTDATEGFTSKLATQVRNKDLTILSGIRIMNNENGQRGAEGSSNFTVRGGVLDMKNTTRGAVIFGCADGVTLENVIFKDMKNNHAIQFTGCTNSVIRNCMFAGYTWGGTFTREVVQIEPSHPGATGAAETAPLRFGTGEYYCPENIEISHCYFGKSDECGAPLMAIGHHSQVGDPNVSGFVIKDNVFDEVMYAAIRYCNVVDAEITGNTFISTSKVKNVDHADATNPAFIVLYSTTSTTSYTSSVHGKKITVAAQNEQAGTHNVRITNNTFKIGKGSDKKVIYVKGSDQLAGLGYASGIYRQDTFDAPAAELYSGYTLSRNYIDTLVFSDNNIAFEGQPDYTSFFMYFYRVHGLTCQNNTVDLGGASFTSASEGITGLRTNVCVMGSYPVKYTVNTGTKGKITLGDSGYTIISKGSYLVSISCENGRLEFAVDDNGCATVTPIPDEGYAFEGWYINKSPVTGDVTLSTGAALMARFQSK